MVNATEMAKPFGKLAKDWLSNKSTKEFLSTLSSVRTIPLTALVEIKQGGNKEQGTWMHEDVALEFARWLSPAFAIWCNDRIKELLTTGSASLQPQLPNFNNPAEAARAWADQYEKNQTLALEVQQQQATIELQEKEIKNVTKNNRFLFGYLNIISTFAMYFNSQGKRKPAICVGIFYAITFCFIVKILIYRLLPPCGVLMHPLPCEVKYNGKGQPFFCL